MDRKQTVYVNGSYSEEGEIHHGVPQGSILGPLLFCLYINDMPLAISSTNVSCELFADDSTLHANEKTVSILSNILQQSLDEIFDWCNNNQMLINTSKTKSMLITTRQKHQNNLSSLQLSLEGEPIEQVRNHRLLGVIIDDQMTWCTHINNLCKTLSRNVFLLSKLRYILNTDCCKSFFHAHIKSHCDYASTLWDSCSDNHFAKLNAVYRRAVKRIVPAQIPTDEKFEMLNILPLKAQLLYNKSLFMYKISINKAPRYLCKLFQFPSTTNLRNSK